MELLYLNLIENSPMINIDGEEIVDLTTNMSNTNLREFTNNKVFIVGDNLTAKPSAIAKFLYGDENKIDLVSYYNGYSNPFAINKGDKLFAPTSDNLNRISSDSKESVVNVAKEAINKKSFSIDPRRNRTISTPNMNDGLRGNIKKEDEIILGGKVDGNTANSSTLNKNFYNNSEYNSNDISVSFV